jgi:hypothetical protein
MIVRAENDAKEGKAATKIHGTPPNKPPKSSGPKVFVRKPRPAANAPMKTNAPRNGMMNHSGGGPSPSSGDTLITDADGSRRMMRAMRSTPRPTPRGKLFALNSGMMSFRMMSPASPSGRTPSETITDLDPHFAITRRDEQEDAVVFLPVPDSPFLEQAIRVLLDRHPVERFDRGDGYLGGGVACERRQEVFKVGLGVRIQDGRVIVDVAVGAGKGRDARNLERQDPGERGRTHGTVIVVKRRSRYGS